MATRPGSRESGSIRIMPRCRGALSAILLAAFWLCEPGTPAYSQPAVPSPLPAIAEEGAPTNLSGNGGDGLTVEAIALSYPTDSRKNAISALKTLWNYFAPCIDRDSTENNRCRALPKDNQKKLPEIDPTSNEIMALKANPLLGNTDYDFYLNGITGPDTKKIIFVCIFAQRRPSPTQNSTGAAGTIADEKLTLKETGEYNTYTINDDGCISRQSRASL